MRLTARLIRTSTLALVAGVISWVILAGGAAGAAAPTLRDGSFSTDLVEATPTIQTPAADATLRYPSQAVNLSWSVVPGAGSYQLQVARHAAGVDCTTSSAFEDANIIVDVATPDTAWTPSLLDSANGSGIVVNAAYCWRVRAAGSTNGNYTAPRSFDIVWTGTPSRLRFYNDEDGSIPRVAGEADYATGDTVGHDTGYLEWAGVPGAGSYDIEISRSLNFATKQLFGHVYKYVGARMVLPQLPDEDGFYWRVRAVTPTGNVGNWTVSSPFSIQRYTQTWTNSGAAYPPYNTSTSDATIGWDPVPGASYYQYQTVTAPSCFWDPTQSSFIPEAYGELSNCRLSDKDPTKSTTVNNYVTLNGVISDEVLGNVAKNCQDPAPVAPAVLVPPCGTGPKGKEIPANIYWRVRPVWQVSQNNETGFQLDEESSNLIYGDWLVNEDAGFQRPNKLRLHHTTPGEIDVIDTGDLRCQDARNSTASGDDCAHLMDGRMSVNNPAHDSTSMQIPLLKWGPFPGAYFDGTTGYSIQIARDPYFTDMLPEFIQGQPEGKGASGGVWDVQQSYMPSNSLADDNDGNGYWWRVIPCDSGGPSYSCYKTYYEGSPGLSYLISGAPGFNDGAQARTFGKQVALRTAQVSSFTGNTPLLKIAALSASTDVALADGVQGADHYEFELSRTPTFTDNARSLKSSVPRLVPSTATGEPIESGTWHWRARPVDRNGLEGPWSDIKSFEVAPAAPTGLTATPDVEDGGALVSWTPVDGADSYEVSFAGTTAVTKQASFRIPSTIGGAVAWRVRATNGTFSIWSDGPVVSLTTPTKLRFAIDKTSVTAGSKISVDGQLLLAGTAVNGKTVQLQRKTTTCNVPGTYRHLASAVTGKKTIQGMVKFGSSVATNGCYRLAYAGSQNVSYSAPFAIVAKPKLRLKVDHRKVRNGGVFCTTVASKSALTGRTQIQYKVGKKWLVARSSAIKSKKQYRQCAAIRTAGTYTVRLALVGLSHPTLGYQTYADTYVGLGKVRVNNVYSISR